MAQWEYKVVLTKSQIRLEASSGANIVIVNDVQNELDKLGDDGWELVSVQDRSTYDGRFFTIAYFKRQKQNSLTVQA